MVLGLLAPELVVYTAWMQWTSARLFAKEINEQNLPGQPELDVVHGFYAGMGGFSFQYEEPADMPTEDESKWVQPSEYYRSMLDEIAPSSTTSSESSRRSKTYTGMIQDFLSTAGSYVECTPESAGGQMMINLCGMAHIISNCGYVFKESKAMITDRSKADDIAKVLVCLQAGNLTIQCLTRLWGHLPISMLEINTLGHVICALLMYAFWLHKPQNIRQPLILTGEVVALLNYITYFRLLMARSSIGVFEFYCFYSEIWNHTASVNRSKLRKIVLTEDLSDDDGVQIANISIYTEDETNEPIIIEPKSYWSLLHYSEVSRHEAILLLACASGLDPLHFQPSILHSGDRTIPNFPKYRGHLDGDQLLVPSAIALATCLYGGLHLSAWHAAFPTSIERWFWRISAAVIAGSGLYLATCLMLQGFAWRIRSKLAQLEDETRRLRALYWMLNRSPRIDVIYFWREAQGGAYFTGSLRILRMVYAWIALAIAAVCVIARLYLVVEAFISLRRMPVAVYQMPPWTVWIPHL